MNTIHSGESVKKKFEIREYQVKGWRDMLSVIKQYLEGTLLIDGKIKDVDTNMLSEYSENLLGMMNYKEDIHLQSSIPLWMATGSGKSYTMGEMMNKIFKLRNRYFPDHPIKSLVLNDRISLVDQLHTDFIEGRDGKPGFLAEHDIHTQIFHSKADQQVEEAYHGDSDEEDHEIDMTTLVNDDEVEIQENTTVSQDTMYFSTLQTAYLKNLDEQITDLDVIIIDEAHKLAGKQKYETLMRFYKPNKHGRLPLVFILSATMNPILHLVNDPVIQFGLPEYIASRHSPQVNYNLVTTHEWTQDDIKLINDQIVQISLIEDLKEKKRAVADLKEQLEEMLKKSTMTDQDLVTDFLQRAPLLDHTIVFAKDIAQADYLAAEFNKQSGDIDTAIAIHSRIDQTDAEVLHAYKSGEKKIIVAVNKLNEGIDMPQTNNIVFWRDTDSDTIFQQQFGRGLRGLEVNVYDYVGGLRNLSWIQGIHQAVEQMHRQEGIDNEEYLEKEENKENLSNLLPFSDQQGEQGFQDNKKDIKEERKNINIRTLKLDKLLNYAPQVDIEGLFQKILNFDEKLNIQLTKQQIEEYFEEVGFERLMIYSTKKIKSIKIKGYGLHTIAQRCGFKSKYNLNIQYPIGFQEFIHFLFGKEFIYEKEEKFDILKTKQYFKKIGFSRLMKYNIKDISTIKIFGYKIKAIALKCGFKSKHNLNVQYPIGFQEFIHFLFKQEFKYEKKEKKVLTKEDIEKYFKEIGFEKLMMYIIEDIVDIEIGGNKITEIAKQYGFNTKHGLYIVNTNGFQEFIHFLFKQEFKYEKKEKKVLTKEDIEKYFKEIGFEKLVRYSTIDITKIIIGGNKITTISTQYGFKSKYGFPIKRPNGFQEFIHFLFKQEFKYNKEF